MLQECLLGFPLFEAPQGISSQFPPEMSSVVSPRIFLRIPKVIAAVIYK